MTAYHEQLKRAIKCGWAHADADSMLAALCQVLALRNALKPEVVYDWAVAHRHDYNALRPHAASREIPDWKFVEAVINDKPLQSIEPRAIKA